MFIKEIFKILHNYAERIQIHQNCLIWGEEM